MSHRTRILTLLAGLLAFPAGCSRCQRTAPNAGGAPQNTIVVGLPEMVRTFDPRFASQERERRILPLIHCALYGIDADGTTVPSLAISPVHWANATTATVELRKNVFFSDGTPVTARDVKATYDFHRIANLPTLQKVEALDSHRLAFSLRKPDETFPRHLTTSILPAPLTETALPLTPEQIKGCGPYVLTNSDPEGFLLQSNPRYAVGEAARTNRLRFDIVVDEKKRLARLRRGRLDLVPDVAEFNAVRELIKKDPSLVTQTRPTLAATYLGFNVSDAALSHRTVRRAIAHAIDRRPIVDFVFGGFATPLRTVLTLDYDPSRAATLLDSAGFRWEGNKPRFRLALQSSTDVMRIQEAKALAVQLEKIGIQVNVETRGEPLPGDDPRVQLWLSKSREGVEQSFAAADLRLVALWREEAVVVHRKNLKGFFVHTDGSLEALATAFKTNQP